MVLICGKQNARKVINIQWTAVLTDLKGYACIISIYVLHVYDYLHKMAMKRRAASDRVDVVVGQSDLKDTQSSRPSDLSLTILKSLQGVLFIYDILVRHWQL